VTCLLCGCVVAAVAVKTRHSARCLGLLECGLSGYSGGYNLNLNKYKPL
jgi:hypothetical protein